MAERSATYHIPDQEGIVVEKKSNSRQELDHQQNRKLKESIARIKKHIAKVEKSREVTQDTMNLRFTI